MNNVHPAFTAALDAMCPRMSIPISSVVGWNDDDWYVIEGDRIVAQSGPSSYRRCIITRQITPAPQLKPGQRLMRGNEAKYIFA